MAKGHGKLVARGEALQNVGFARKQLQNSRFPLETHPAILVAKVPGMKELQRNPVVCLDVPCRKDERECTVATGRAEPSNILESAAQNTAALDCAKQGLAFCVVSRHAVSQTAPAGTRLLRPGSPAGSLGFLQGPYRLLAEPVIIVVEVGGHSGDHLR